MLGRSMIKGAVIPASTVIVGEAAMPAPAGGSK
jgi:hypothetical protein